MNTNLLKTIIALLSLINTNLQKNKFPFFLFPSLWVQHSKGFCRMFLFPFGVCPPLWRDKLILFPLRGLGGFLFLLSSSQAWGQQAGTLDEFLNTDGATNFVSELRTQSDGKILIAGSFSKYNGVNRNGIARINSDGSLDNTFNPGTGANNSVFKLEIQPNGKILIGGTFTQYNGVSRNKVARLNTDGSLDNTFIPYTGSNDFVYALTIQSNGKILIGGDFNNNRINIRQLNTDGSLDNTFNPGTGANGLVQYLAIQPDGRILIAGEFTQYNGMSRNRIARLNADGSLDNTFNPGTGANDSVQCLAIQPDGRILIGGFFTTYNNINRSKIARLNKDGSLDSSFNPITGAEAVMYAIRIRSDGKILIGGGFTTYNGESRNNITLLNANGSLDNVFHPGTGADKVIYSLNIQQDSKILICGGFTEYDGISRNNVARVNEDGSPDIYFNIGTGIDNVGFITSLAIRPDGKILAGGFFSLYNGESRNKIAQIHPNGSLDNSFYPKNGLSSFLDDMVIQPDGKILIGGSFTEYNGINRNRIARLNTDGSLDNTFNPNQGASNFVNALAIQPDGKIFIGGNFTEYNGIVRNRIARLNTDGSLDNTFNPNAGADDWISVITIQPDGKILIGGSFALYDGIARNRIARLNKDGSLDNSFNPIAGADNFIYSLVIQPDGKILIGGSFTEYNGINRKGIARLNTDGSLDNSFNSENGTNSTVNAIVIQPDGKILIGGFFTEYNKISRRYMARLNVDGTLDNSFNPAGANNYVNSLAIQPNGRVLLGGSFRKYNSVDRGGIARIYCSVPAIPVNLSALEPQATSFRLRWNKVLGIDTYEVDVSNNNFASILAGYQSRLIKDTSLVIENIQAGRVYSCRVRAINEQGSSPSSEILEVIIKPAIPDNLAVKPLSLNQIELRWEANLLEGNTYNLEFAKDRAEGFTALTQINSNTYTHSGLSAGTTYYYRIRAFKNGAFSGYSEVVGAATFSDVVTNLENSAKNKIRVYPNPTSADGKVVIELTDNSNEIIQIRILNAQGQELRLIQTSTLDSEINISGLTRGLYFLHIETKKGIFARKIIRW